MAKLRPELQTVYQEPPAWTLVPDGTAAGRYHLRFKYSAGLIEELKRVIPRRDRGWDGKRDAWSITPAACWPAILLMDRWFGTREAEQLLRAVQAGQSATRSTTPQHG
jgi:hypothetical protein